MRLSCQEVRSMQLCIKLRSEQMDTMKHCSELTFLFIGG